MNIRSIRESDYLSITEIYNHYIQHSFATFEIDNIDHLEIKQRIGDIQSVNLPWIVAEQNGQILGYAYASPWKARKAYKHSVEITVYTHQNNQAKGVGSQLYKRLFSELTQLPVHAAMAGISLPNDASIALHEKFGMKKVAEFPQVGRKFDKWIDVGYWQKLF